MYKYTILKFDDYIVFHICMNNFHVEKTCVQSFVNEVRTTAPVVAPVQAPGSDYNACSLTQHLMNNIGRVIPKEDIANLCQQGIEVENEDFHLQLKTPCALIATGMVFLGLDM